MFRALATAALVAAVAASAPPASAQRLSLAERVDRLEQQQSSPQQGGAVDLVNRISALQSQVQALQGQVEELKHALDESRQRDKDQYTDLDSRLARLEGGNGAPAPARGAPPAAVNAPPPDIQLGGPDNGGARRPARGNVGNLTDADRGAVPPRDDSEGAAPAPDDTAEASAPAAAADENGAYNEAFAALKDGRYAESARRFQAFIDRYPDSALAGNAYYWLGESYYVTQNYSMAEESFQTLLSRYPDSQKAPDALLKTGYCQYEQKQWDAAEATLNEVVAKYPDTTVARLAQGRLRAIGSDARR